MKGGDTMKSQARWNKIYQKKLRKQQEREQQKRLTCQQAKVSRKNNYTRGVYHE